MMNRWLRLSRILVVTASLSLMAAAAQAQGFNLSWGDCGAAGTLQKTFACTSNSLTGAVIVASAMNGTPIPQLNSEESVMTLQTNQSPLPAWWLIQAGGCRTGAAFSLDFTGGPFTCMDPWVGAGAGGMNAELPGDGRLRLRTVGAIAGSTSITGTDEYYFFKITILGSKSTGTGSCAGCDVGACIVFNNLKLSQPAGVGDFNISTALVREYVEWQTGGASVPGGCPAATPTRNATWGSVKSLYR